jgi:hypothetical protein
MLRRRSRSTPTEDVELGARPPVGVTSAATADEMIIAAADGELAHMALDRLSVRHRHVLALREDSGWTYQQIADHEGVEIGTIETLLWRARQALKREFLALSESKGSFAGFLLGLGAAIRTVVVRSAHRVAALQPSPGSGAFRNAVAGFAVTSAAITAAFIAPHALDSHQAQVPLPAPAVAGTGAGLGLVSITTSAGSARGSGSTTASGAHRNGGGSASNSSGSVSGSGSGGSVSRSVGSVGALDPILGSSGAGLLSGAADSTAPATGLAAPAQSQLPQELLGSVASGASSVLSKTVSGATDSPVAGNVSTTAGAIAATVAGLGSALGSGTASSPLGSSLLSPAQPAAPATTTTTAPASGLEGVTATALSALHLLGQG